MQLSKWWVIIIRIFCLEWPFARRIFLLKIVRMSVHHTLKLHPCGNKGYDFAAASFVTGHYVKILKLGWLPIDIRI